MILAQNWPKTEKSSWRRHVQLTGRPHNKLGHLLFFTFTYPSFSKEFTNKLGFWTIFVMLTSTSAGCMLALHYKLSIILSQVSTWFEFSWNWCQVALWRTRPHTIGQSMLLEVDWSICCAGVASSWLLYQVCALKCSADHAWRRT